MQCPSKLAIVAGSAGDVASGFASTLRNADVELLVVLESFDDVRSEIRRALPVWLARQWIRTVLVPLMEPHLCVEFGGKRTLLDTVFCSSPVSGWGRPTSQLSKCDDKRIDELLLRSGFRTVFAIRGALLLLVYYIAVKQVGLAANQALGICGMRDARLIMARAEQVLGANDLDELNLWSMESVVKRIVSFICRGSGDAATPVAVPCLGDGSVAWLDTRESAVNEQLLPSTEVEEREPEYEAFWCSLVAELDGFLSGYLWKALKHRERTEDAKQAIWLSVHLRIQRGGVSGLPLTAQGVKDHRDAWKGILLALCQGEISNVHRGLNRRTRLREALDRAADDSYLWLGRVSAPEDVAQRKELRRVIKLAVAALPARLRDSAELGFVLRFREQEVAAELAITERTVRRRLVSASGLLQVALGAVWDDYWRR